jgi:diguanylate cyclase (GGDEF)-like protein/PAS domain S-box-containing protein
VIRPLKILLVEDEAHDAELVLRVLERAGIECSSARVDTEAAFRRALDEFVPDVVLSDFSMPLFDGMSALAISHATQPHLPFIFVSGTIGEEHAISALKHGATDYVLKGDLARLVPAIERALDDVRQQAEQRRMRAALQHSEQRFRLAASTGDVWDWNLASGEAYISHQFKQRLGYADDELSNQFETWMGLLHPDDREPVQQALAAHVQTSRPLDIECRSRGRDGDYRWSHVKGQALWDAEGRASYMAGSVVDITERKLAEIKVRRLNRVYAVLSGINSLIVRVKSRDELFREACRMAVEAGHFRHAWIGLADRTAQQLRPAAWHGLDADAVAPQALSLAPDAQGDCGLATRALKERQPVIIEDVQGAARIAPAPGLRSVAILPLLVGDEAVGALALYAAEAGFFDAAEMKLLLELAGDIAFALDHIQKADKLNYLAYYDELTGLANRSLFMERVAQYVETARRDKHKLAVLALNIDRFKTINDSLGWPAGDDLLKQIAARFLCDATDPSWYARLDADHFAIVIPEIGSEESMARRIEQNAAMYFDAPFMVAGAELRISARFGIALFPNDGGDADTLFRHAEAAAQKAKARGERYLFYAQDMTEKSPARWRWRTSCAVRWSASSSCCTTSPRSTARRAGS